MRFRLTLQGGLMVLCLMGIFTTCLAQGQAAKKMFYIYIQNESGQPFYVKKGSALMSSSPEGYIVIPQLTKGSYDLTIGFPKNEAPEASFKINLDGSSDKGFLIRKQNKGFELLGLKDFNVIKAAAVASAPGNRIVEAPASAQPPAQKTDTGNGVDTGKKDQALAVLTPEKDQQSPPPAAVPPEKTAASPDDSDASDAFSRMLNEITGNSKNTPVKTSKPVKQVPVQDTPAAAVTEKPADQVETPTQTASENQGLETNQPVEQASQPAPQTVTENRRSSEKNEPQFITFAPDTAASGQKDYIPQDQRAGQPADQAVQVPQPSIEVDSAEMARREQKEARKARRLAKREAKRQQDSLERLQTMPVDGDISSPQNVLSGTMPAVDHQVAKNATADSLSRTPMMNSDCKHMAGEDDFQKVRRKMASRSNEEAMFSAARKYFNGGTCYTTVQIQSLTYLFMTDEYKYKFLELAYPHTADARNFPSLVKTLGSDYYRGRFKAMVK